jgi:gliding motility-associated-like protein
VSNRNYAVTVTDTCGMQAERIVNVEIREVRADFDYAYFGYYGLKLVNYSRGEGLTYLWDFGDGEFSEEEDPTHNFTGLDRYRVVLTATDLVGCQDTAVFITDPPVEIFVPTAFTPNGDGINDLFGISSANVTYFEMWIFDRWGKQVFYSNDIDKKWNGATQDGEYYPGTSTFNYLIKYQGEKEEDATEITGFVTLIR